MTTKNEERAFALYKDIVLLHMSKFATSELTSNDKMLTSIADFSKHAVEVFAHALSIERAFDKQD